MPKNLLRIGEASELLGIDIQTLRRWEERDLLIPSRTVNGHRRYSLEQVVAIRNDRSVLTFDVAKRKEAEIRQMVSLLAKGIIELDNLIKQNALIEYPKSWVTASVRLHNLSLELNGDPFPFNIYDQQKYWRIPLCDWPIPHLSEIFSEDDEMGELAVFYDGEITEYCTDVAREYGQEEDVDLIIFKKWMNGLRQKFLAPIDEEEKMSSSKEYRDLRLFFSPDHSILDLKRSRISTLSKLPEQYRSGIVEHYQPIPPLYIYYSDLDMKKKVVYKCPYCGWTLLKTKYKSGEVMWRCGSSKCQRAVERTRKEKIWRNPEEIEYVNSLVRVKSGVREYLTVPGIPEYHLYKKLKKIPNIKVEIYPDCDACDISIQFSDGEYWLVDIKDWLNYRSLARKLKERPPFQYYANQNWERACVVVPMHYNQQYIRQLSDRLDNIHYEIIGFHKFFAQVEQKVNGGY